MLEICMCQGCQGDGSLDTKRCQKNRPPDTPDTLHFLGGGYAEEVEAVFYCGAGGVRQFQAGEEQVVVFAFDAACAVEFVESGCQFYDVFVYSGRVAVAGCKPYFFRK